MKTVTLKNCSNQIEAEMLKGHLEAEGIECILTNVTMSGYPPNSGVDILVSEDAYDRAVAILKEVEPASDAKQPEPATDEPSKMATVLISHAVFYLIGFPVTMLLIDLLFSGHPRAPLYYLGQGFFFSLFMTAFKYFDLKKRMKKK